MITLAVILLSTYIFYSYQRLLPVETYSSPWFMPMGFPNEHFTRAQIFTKQNSLISSVCPTLPLARSSSPCPSHLCNLYNLSLSNLTDLREEREFLEEVAYPKLREFSERLGLNCHVVDMRNGAGVLDNSLHTFDLIEKELKMCRNLSIGPYFVVCLY